MLKELNKKRLLIVGVILLVFTIGGAAGFLLHQVSRTSVNAQSEQISVEGGKIENFRKLFVVYDILQQHYVEETDSDNLLTGAIRGMLNSLDDPYTGYLPPKEYEDMQEDFSGEYSGIGIVITMRDEQLTIVSPFEGTPGDKAGLEAEDEIIEIDGVSTEGMTMEDAVDRMKGQAGTEVILKIRRSREEKNSKEFEVEITRAEIEVPFVTSEIKDNDIGYIALSQFIENAGSRVNEEIERLSQEGAQAFVLDLRNNPGGLLMEASPVASNFLAEGPVVTIKDREQIIRTIDLEEGITPTEKPLVVLVNKGSASASEIIAGAVQDTERGKIVGTSTFGKGVVQSVVPLADGSAIKITTARYYTPADRYIHHDGIEPDYEVEIDLETEEDEQLEEGLRILREILEK